MADAISVSKTVHALQVINKYILNAYVSLGIRMTNLTKTHISRTQMYILLQKRQNLEIIRVGFDYSKTLQDSAFSTSKISSVFPYTNLVCPL